MIRRAEGALAGWLTRARCTRFAGAVTATVIVGALVSYAVGRPMVDSSNTIIGADFSAFFIGGHLVRQGREAELYDFALQKAEHDALIAPVKSLEFHPYINPPFFAAAVAPLAALPYRAALTVWWTGGATVLLTLLSALRRELMPLREVPLARLVWLSLLFYPTAIAFLFGQNSVFTLGLLTLFVLAARRGRDLTAGLAIGVLLYKPQLALGPCLVLLTQRRLRGLLGIALGAGAWLALGLTTTPSAMRDYLRVAPRLFDLLGHPAYPMWGLESLYGFSLLLLGDVRPGLGKLLGHALTAAGAALIVASWLRERWCPATRGWDLRLAATLALSLVTSPHLYHYDALLLLLPFALLLAHTQNAHGDLPLDGGPLLAYSGLLYASLVLGPILCHTLRTALHALGLAAPVPQVATCAIVLWALALLRTANEGRPPTSSQPTTKRVELTALTR